MEAERNKVLVKAFVQRINAQDWDGLDELVAPEFTRHSRAAGQPEVRSREQLKNFLRREFEIFPDAEEKIEDLVAEGDKVAARQRFHGTQQGPIGRFPPTNKEMKTDYLAIYRVENGRIIEAWAEWDNLSGLQQLGHYELSS